MLLPRTVLVAAWLILVYETVAILAGWWPTITAVSRHHPALMWALIAGLVGLCSWGVAHLAGSDR